MADLLIEKSKKTEWLQKYGTPDALELLGLQVDELNNKAVQNRLLSKEIDNMEVGNVADPLDSLTEQPNVNAKTPDGFDDLSGLADINKEVAAQVETPAAVTSTVVATPVVAVVKESVVAEQVDENRELIDTLIVEIVNPMVEELKEVRKEIAAVRAEKALATAQQEALQTQLNNLQKELQVQGLQLKEETLPQASTAALLKNYIKEQLSKDSDESVTFGKSVATADPILTKKPAEQKAKGYEQNGVFGGFLDGR